MSKKDIKLVQPTFVIPPLRKDELYARGEDTIRQINTSVDFDNPIVRIATIGDGNCFFHAVLKAVYDVYQENNKYRERVEMAERFRRDIAYELGLPYTGDAVQQPHDLKNYDIIMGGYLPSSAREIPTTIGKYNLSSMQRLLNSRQYVGDEVWPLIPGFLGIHLVVIQLVVGKSGEDKINHIYSSFTASPYLPYEHTIVVISTNNNHYEIVGELGETGFIRTVFGIKEKISQTMVKLNTKL